MRILVVDDEPLVRKGIVSLMKQHPEASDICEAGNGLTAVEIIKQDPPDVVLTDVLMPGMDGIELLKWIMAYCPGIKSVVLSSHQDFKYVKQAFVFGARDYLLKYDIEEKVFFDMLDLFSRELNDEKDTVSVRKKDINRLAKDTQPFDGKISAVCIPRERSDAEYSGFIKSLGYPVSFYVDADYAFMLCASEYADELAGLCAQAFECSAGISGEGRADQPDELFYQSRNALSVRYFGGDSVIKYSEGMGESELSPYVLELKKRISAEILGFSLSQTIRLLEEISGNVSTQRECSVIQIRLLYVSVAELLFIRYDEIFTQHSMSVDQINKRIMSERTLKGTEDILFDLIQIVINDSLHIIDFHDCSELVKKSAEYINTHFGNGALNLKMISEHLGYAAPYLSRVFKNETGVNVVDYINELRILTAKTMLKNGNQHVYEVAQAVGYNNYNYFGKIFKRIVGLSPTEYLDSIS